jgi:hypothetical protein
MKGIKIMCTFPSKNPKIWTISFRHYNATMIIRPSGFLSSFYLFHLICDCFDMQFDTQLYGA